MVVHVYVGHCPYPMSQVVNKLDLTFDRINEGGFAPNPMSTLESRTPITLPFPEFSYYFITEHN